MSRNLTAADLFRLARERPASDVHLKSGQPPLLRTSGTIAPTDLPVLGHAEILALAQAIMSEPVRRRFDETGSVDFAYELESGDRFRVNAFRQRGHASLVARRVNRTIPSFAELHLPATTLERVCQATQGLVIFAGVRGTGKSTSLAACLEHINRHRRCHIVTVEDPIEFSFDDKQAFINQREVGTDVPTFDEALRCLAREDPDVVLVGEVRDRNTCESVLRAAEATRLVFTTVHAKSAPAVIARILEMTQGEDRRLFREMLASSLVTIICQVLVPASDPNVARVPATEVLMATPSVRKMIADGEDARLEAVIAAHNDQGMHNFTQDLARLVKEEWVDLKVALEMAPNPEALKMAVRGVSLQQGTL
jgi:twitching motility protein PilT